MYQLLPDVRSRVDIWIDPFARPPATGYQIIQSLYAFGRGGLLGTGLGAGLPTIGGQPADPRRSTRTSRSPRSARSWA